MITLSRRPQLLSSQYIQSDMAEILHDLWITSSASEVFEALSTPAQLEKWWPLQCTGEQRVGGKYNFIFEEPYDWWGEVASYEPDQSFYIKMTKSDADWDPTTFGFDLYPDKDKVWLQFCHRGWQTTERHFRHSSYCWAVLLYGLKRYLEEGHVVPFEKRA